ncbi:IS66 family transposase [Tateyamaria sp.]|uniref:IS66 family transposase n=1 Tax=Tateyamaria sp. TaxID=1929288 RepID=UPI00329A9CEC
MQTITQKLAKFECMLREANVVALRGEFEELRDAVIAQGKELLRLSGRIKSLDNQNKKLTAEIKAKDAEIARLLHERHAPSADTKTAPKKKDTEENDGCDASSESTGTDSNNRNPKNYSADPPPSDKRQGGRGPKDWSSLPRVEVPYDGPEECPCGCGGTVRSFKIQERLQVIPAVYYVAITNVPRVRCRWRNGQEQMVSLPFTPSLLPGTGMGTSAIAHFVTQRFGWGLPWYRIETMLRYAGLKVYRSTLMRQANGAARAVMGIYYALVEAILGNSIRVFVDETPVPIIREGKGQTGKAYMYAVHRDDRPFGGSAPTATFFATRDTRAGHHIHDMFAGRSLIAQHDGYGGYAQFGKLGTALEHIVSAECWAHARRNFIKYYQTTGSDTAREIIDLIDELFRFERDISGLSPSLRKQERGRHQKPIVQKIFTRLEEIRSSELKSSKVGKAINYVLKRQESLSLFLENGHVDLDTNAVERQFKPIQMLRKNVYFMGSQEGGETWAVFSSLIETCKLNGVDPYRYFVWVFDELATLFHRNAQPVIDYRTFLPWNAPENCKVGSKSDAADQGVAVHLAA